MRTDIGFILLTHTNPAQIWRLIDRLDRMFDHPPVVVHHDFSKTALYTTRLPDNISFVIPSLDTGWGRFSFVEAEIAAIRQLYSSPAAPDWFVLLSGSDYPIKSAAQIRRELAASAFDAYIYHQQIDPHDLKLEAHYICYKNYFASSPDAPIPFSDEFRCYAGGVWFTANRRTAERILDFHDTQPALASHYASRLVVDESYLHCILGNSPDLKLFRDSLRYIDWSANEAHPKTLGIEDFPKLIASHAHFARKFDMDHDSAVLDALDRVIAAG
jgi:hypothetical protein